MTSSPSRVLPAVLIALCIGACARHKTPSRSQPAAPTVNSEDIARSPAEPIEEQLMSRFPGVTVSRNSHGLVIRIRGQSTFNGSNEPLYVIDGIKIRPGLDGTLAGLDPHEIEQIQVLKDAVSMVTYGGDAANGIILIRTKHAEPRH